MYTIGNIIYGVPLTPELVSYLEDSADCAEDELEDLGFELLYHGAAAEARGYCGEHLGEIDECEDVDLESGECPLRRPLTDDAAARARESVERMLARLPEEARALVPPVSRYIVWSTS